MILKHNFNSHYSSTYPPKSYEDRQILDFNSAQGESVNLRIGPQGASSLRHKIINIREQAIMVLEPGDIAIISSLEVLHVDMHHYAQVELLPQYAKKGLHIQTGLEIQPGFVGRLFVMAVNTSHRPIGIPYNDDF